MTEWLLLGVAVLLMLACGGFVAAEFAFVTVSRSAVEAAAASGDRRAQGTLAALRTLSTQLSSAQLGITITNLAIGFLSEPALASLLRGPLTSAGLPDGAVSPTAIALALVISTIMTMVIGELVPKNLAIALPLKTAGAVQGFQRGFTTSAKWAIAFLNGSANRILRRLGVEPQEELASARSPEELTALVRRSGEQGTLELGTARLVQRSIAFAEQRAVDVMTPRIQMEWLDPTATVQQLLDLSERTGHSRFPVIDPAEPEHALGVVHVRAAAGVAYRDRPTTPIASLLAPARSVPESVRLDPLLDTLRSGGQHLAVVVDEFGALTGVVSIEDLVEEIVGELADEHDPSEPRIDRRADGSWVLSGLLRPDEISHALDIVVPESDDYETIGGLVTERIQRLPAVGDAVTVPIAMPGRSVELGVTVLSLDGARIESVRVEVRELDGDGDGGDRGGDRGDR